MNLDTFRLIAAPHTPFTNEGALNLRIVDHQARHLVETGADGAFIVGSTGEGQSLTVEERIALADRWVEVCRGTKLSVIVHVGSNCLETACKLASHAQYIGADAIAAHAPFFFRPTTVEELIEFLAPIAESAAELPFYYYDVPGATKVELSSVEFLQQAGSRILNLAGVKFTNSDLGEFQQCVQMQDGKYDILFGCDDALAVGILLGARGAVGSSYSFAAPLFRRIIDAMKSDNLTNAQSLQYQAAELVDLLKHFGYMRASKALMRMIGIDCGEVRRPLQPLSDDEYSALHAQLVKFAKSGDPREGESNLLGPHFDLKRSKQRIGA